MMETMLGAIDLAAGLVTTVPQLRQATESSEGGAGWLLAAGPVSAAALYAALYRYYRNTDKSHQYEKETAVTSWTRASRHSWACRRVPSTGMSDMKSA